ncbi:MAG: hypothetical protein R2711_12145 [Acidimicrobiales bacterium]
MAVVVQLSDTHLRGRVGPEDHALRRAVLAVRAAAGSAAGAIALTGDLADDARWPRSSGSPPRSPASMRPSWPRRQPRPRRVRRAGVQPAGPARRRRLAHRAAGGAGARRGPQAVDVDAARALADHAGHPTLLLAHHPPLGPSTHPGFTLRHGDGLLELLAERRTSGRSAPKPPAGVPVRRRALLVLGANPPEYAIRHEGLPLGKAPSAPIGAVVWHLGGDGTARPALVPSLPADRAGRRTHRRSPPRPRHQSAIDAENPRPTPGVLHPELRACAIVRRARQRQRARSARARRRLVVGRR